MKKLILPTLFLFLTSPLFFTWVSSVRAIDLSGEWVGASGEKVTVDQSGNTFSVEVDASKYSVKVGLKGTITGNTYTGEWYGTSDDCPHLAGYFPARGIISEGKIEVKIDSIKYNPETCVKTSDYEDSYSFIRVTASSVTPQVEKKEPQLPKDTNPKDKSEDNLKIPDLSPKSLEELNSDFWTSIKFKEKAQSVSSWIDQNLGVYEPVVTPKSIEREPQLKQGQPSSESEARKVTESHLIPGAVIKNYQDGVIIEISKGGWVYIDPSGEVNYGTDRWRNYFDILMGTVEVKTEKNAIDAKTPNTNVKSKGTHYWVSYDPKKKETTVGVYEGEVEVQSKDGKTTTVSPSNGKPGVVIVSVKLSPVKLVLAGLVVAAVIGGAFMILRRKFSSKGFNNKKK